MVDRKFSSAKPSPPRRMSEAEDSKQFRKSREAVRGEAMPWDEDVKPGRFPTTQDKADTYLDKSREKYARLEHALRIDKNDLDTMLEQQPQLYYEVGYELAWHVSRRDALKQELKEAEAAADAKARHQLEVESDGKRAREGEVATLVIQDRTVITLRDKLLRQDQTVGRWDALKSAYMQRAYVLKDLVQLYAVQYYMDGSGRVTSNTMRDVKADKGKRALSEMYREERNRKDD